MVVAEAEGKDVGDVAFGRWSERIVKLRGFPSMGRMGKMKERSVQIRRM